MLIMLITALQGVTYEEYKLEKISQFSKFATLHIYLIEFSENRDRKFQLGPMDQWTNSDQSY